MGSPAVSPLVNLVVRVLSIIILVASLIVLATDNITYELDFYDSYQLKFTDVYAYRYMLSVMVIGLAWSLLQSVLTISHFSFGKRLGGDAFAHIEFYGDKVISYLLGTGAAAGFGLTVEAKRDPTLDSFENDFFNKANIAASLLLVGFLFSSISSVFSSYNLPK